MLTAKDLKLQGIAITALNKAKSMEIKYLPVEGEIMYMTYTETDAEAISANIFNRFLRALRNYYGRGILLRVVILKKNGKKSLISTRWGAKKNTCYGE